MHKILDSTGNFEVRRVDMVGPKVGGELRTQDDGFRLSLIYDFSLMYLLDLNGDLLLLLFYL